MDSPGNGTPEDGGVEIGEAARQLGLSVEALRKRLQRGRMRGRKGADGRWRVVLDGTAVRAPGAPAPPAVLAGEAVLPLAAELRAIRLELEGLNRRLADLAGLIALLAPQRVPSRQVGRDDRLKPVLMDVLAYLKRLNAAPPQR